MFLNEIPKYEFRIIFLAKSPALFKQTENVSNYENINIFIASRLSIWFHNYYDNQIL